MKTIDHQTSKDTCAETSKRLDRLVEQHDNAVPADKIIRVLQIHVRKLDQHELADQIEDILLARDIPESATH